MSELFGGPEETEKLIEESIARLRHQIRDEQVAMHERIQRIEQQSKERIRDAERDFYDRVEPMRRQLDEMVRVASLKHVYSTVPSMIIQEEKP